MLLIEKILNKRISNVTPIRILERSVSIKFDDGSSFVTIEELTDSSYILFIDKNFINELHYMIGIDKGKISFEIYEWLKNKTVISSLNDIRKLYK